MLLASFAKISSSQDHSSGLGGMLTQFEQNTMTIFGEAILAQDVAPFGPVYLVEENDVQPPDLVLKGDGGITRQWHKGEIDGVGNVSAGCLGG